MAATSRTHIAGVRLFFVLTKFACLQTGMITLIAGRRLCAK
jgi:hypothetical protein